MSLQRHSCLMQQTRGTTMDVPAPCDGVTPHISSERVEAPLTEVMHPPRERARRNMYPSAVAGVQDGYKVTFLLCRQRCGCRLTTGQMPRGVCVVHASPDSLEQFGSTGPAYLVWLPTDLGLPGWNQWIDVSPSSTREGPAVTSLSPLATIRWCVLRSFRLT